MWIKQLCTRKARDFAMALRARKVSGAFEKRAPGLSVTTILVPQEFHGKFKQNNVLQNIFILNGDSVNIFSKILRRLYILRGSIRLIMIILPLWRQITCTFWRCLSHPQGRCFIPIFPSRFFPESINTSTSHGTRVLHFIVKLVMQYSFKNILCLRLGFPIFRYAVELC